MSTIRLSICISTLNRGEFIGETLASIIPQLTDESELIVLDGASTDNTKEVVEDYAARCPKLNYVRLEQGLGFDEKYCRLVEMARGEFCWLFADDDLLKPGAVVAVLEAIRRDYSLIVVNAEVASKDLGICLQSRRVSSREDRVYSSSQPDRDELLAATCMYLTYIGAIVVKRAVWNQRERAKYFGTLFVHVAVIFQSPLPGDTLVLEHPWIVIRYGNALWTPRSFEIWMFSFPELVWSFPDFSDQAKNRVEKREPWRCWHRLLMERAMGHYSLHEYRRWLEARFRSPFARLIARFIAATPAGLLNFLARFTVKWLFRKSPSMTLYDLERWRPADKATVGSTKSSAAAQCR
jgi:glycosyltransferase involved in cell wall biosynthesis